MDRNVFTVLFQPPFWVGIAERWEEAGYSAARVVFGAEPTDAQIYQWLEREWLVCEREARSRRERERQDKYLLRQQKKREKKRGR